MSAAPTASLGQTRVAVGRWQEERGQRVTCMPDAAMVKSIH
jgi:hypothetical protein